LIHIPCITLRGRTEWIETVRLSANTLVGNDREKIVKRQENRKTSNPFGDGVASRKVIEILIKNA